jgi:hypothetical protein
MSLCTILFLGIFMPGCHVRKEGDKVFADRVEKSGCFWEDRKL